MEPSTHGVADHSYGVACFIPVLLIIIIVKRESGQKNRFFCDFFASWFVALKPTVSSAVFEQLYYHCIMITSGVAEQLCLPCVKSYGNMWTGLSGDSKWWLQFNLIPVTVWLHSRLILKKKKIHKEDFGI